MEFEINIIIIVTRLVTRHYAICSEAMKNARWFVFIMGLGPGRI